MKHFSALIFSFSFFLLGFGQTSSFVPKKDAIEIIDKLSNQLLSDYLYFNKAEIIVEGLKKYKAQLFSNQDLEI